MDRKRREAHGPRGRGPGRGGRRGAGPGGRTAQIGERLSTISADWIRNNEEEAKRAGNLAAEAIEASRRRLLVSTAFGLLLSAIVGVLTFRRIAVPIRALQETVETIAAGDYSRTVPFTGASDETGALARSIDVLKGGASAMEDQRWVKAGVARLAAEVQEADSLAEARGAVRLGARAAHRGRRGGVLPERGGLGSPPQDCRLRPRRRRGGRGVVPGGGGPRRRVRPAESPGRARRPAARLPQDYLWPGGRRARECRRLAGRLPRRGPGCPRARLVPPSAPARRPSSGSCFLWSRQVSRSSPGTSGRGKLLERTQEQARKLEVQTVALSESQEALRGAAGGAEGHRGADAPHPGVDCGRDPRCGRGGPDRLRQ